MEIENKSRRDFIGDSIVVVAGLNLLAILLDGIDKNQDLVHQTAFVEKGLAKGDSYPITFKSGEVSFSFNDRNYYSRFRDGESVDLILSKSKTGYGFVNVRNL